MKILVTGANGFIGKNILKHLSENDFQDVITFNRNNSASDLDVAIKSSEFIFHLAGVNRSDKESDFKATNIDLTKRIIKSLNKFGKKTPILFSSTIKVSQNSPYGVTKRIAEELISNYGNKTGAVTHIYRLPNVFGKWCRPDYNSVVATFCNNIISEIPIRIDDPNSKINLVYIDEVCKNFIRHLNNPKHVFEPEVKPVYETTVGNIATILNGFKVNEGKFTINNVGSGFLRKLYSTYLSYLKQYDFHSKIPIYQDERGLFAEIIKTKSAGQFSFFTARPGMTRGNHYHHTKNEKFLVVKGKALFKFHNIITKETYDLCVEDSDPTLVTTIPGWAHSITNSGTDELVVMLWANEIFDRENPDTISYEV